MAKPNFKAMLNTLALKSNILHELTQEEQDKLKDCLLFMYRDVYAVCKKYNLTIMLGGGSALGSVRHQGFIPWDDDLDLMMPRADYEKLKEVFEKELGDKYVLSAPNYKGKSKARFPKIMKKGTSLKELTDLHSDLPAGVFLDIFLLENVPENRAFRKLKGFWCNVLMYASTRAYWYEHRGPEMKEYMCQTEEGRKDYRTKMIIGGILSVVPSWKWFNAIDRCVQYHKQTSMMGIPTGSRHYFGEILPRDAMVPVSYGLFCGEEAPLPAVVDVYLKNLYKNYMEIPPIEKRERHFIVEVDVG